MAIKDKVKLTQVLNGLKKAAAFGLSDAQGFINPNAASPLSFIDVHSIDKWMNTGTKKDPDAEFRPTPTNLFDASIETAERKLKQL